MNTATAIKQDNTIQFPVQQTVTLTADQLQNLISQAVAGALAGIQAPAPQVQSQTKKERRAPTPSAYKTDGVKKARAAEPLYSAREFQKVADYFLTGNKRHGKRNYMMLVLGCTIGDRGGDLLCARICDVANADGTVKEYYEVYEQKTGKYSRNKITAAAKEAIQMYLDSKKGKYSMDDFLIQSQKNKDEPMSIQQMWRILNEAGEKVGLTQNIGTHTLRKTYGFTARMANEGDSVMDTLQAKYKHSDQRTTKTYLTITQGEIDRLADSVDAALYNSQK